jgi:acetyl-CoA carboxylase biotin carboxyl carrier protein
MNLDDIKQILDLVREHDLAEFELEQDGLKVRVRKASAQQQVVMVPSSPAVAAAVAPAGPVAAGGPALASAGDETGPEGVALAVVKSPIVGTLYIAPDPDAKPFVEVGDQVRKGQVLCIIEAMKLMNEIECDCDGELAAIYVENGQPVQFGDRLFAVKVK